MVRPDLVNERVALRKCNEMIRITGRWRNDPIQVGWEKSLFAGAAYDSACLRRRSRIADQHFDPIKHKRLRAQEYVPAVLKMFAAM